MQRAQHSCTAPETGATFVYTEPGVTGRPRRTSLLVFVLPPALAIFAALYSLEHRAFEGARIFGQLLGPEGLAAPPGIEIALVREETLSLDSPAARGCCEGCSYTLFDERCDRAAQTIAELIDARMIGVAPNRAAITGSTGWFELDRLPPGRYAIFGAAPRGLLAFARNVEIAPLEQSKITLESTFRASLSGAVSSEDGEPIAGASVSAIDPRIGRIFSATTDAAGRFELRDLDPLLEYYLLARANTFAPRGRPATTADQDVALELEEGASVSGVVLSGGKPVEGARLTLDELMYQPRTGADGKFRFDHLTSGYHVLRAAQGDTLGRRHELQLPQGTARHLTLELAPVCTLRVRVEDGEGEPIAGADVRLLAKEAIDHRAAKTDDEGAALFEMLALSTYEIDARRADRGQASAVLELTASCISRNEKLVILDSAGVRGVVRGEDGKAIGDVELSLEYLDAENESADAVRLSRTDAQGRFRVPSLAPGTWQLTALKEGFVETAEVFEMHDARVDEDLKLILSRGGTIDGRIIDLSGRPVSDWTVYARSGTDVAARPSLKPHGSFSFSGLRSGRYELHAEPSSGGDRPLELGTARTATIAAVTGAQQVILRAPGTGILSGSVTFSGGPPPESFSITVPGLGGTTFDGLSGRFRLPAAIAARYPLIVRAPGYSSDVSEVQIIRGQETSVQILLEAAVELRGLVLDATDGTPIPGADITVLSERKTTLTHKDGRFEVRGLPPGEHLVFVRANGYGTAKIGPISVEGGAEVPELEARLDRANASVHGRVHTGKTAPAESVVLLVPHQGENDAVYESTGRAGPGSLSFDAIPPGAHTLIVAVRARTGAIELERRTLQLTSQNKEIDVDFGERGGKQKLRIELGRAREYPCLISVRGGALDDKTIAERELEALDPVAAVVLDAGKRFAVFERMPSGKFTVSVSELRAEDRSLKAIALGELVRPEARPVELKGEKETRLRF